MSYAPAAAEKNLKNAVEAKEYMIKERLYSKAQPLNIRYNIHSKTISCHIDKAVILN